MRNLSVDLNKQVYIIYHKIKPTIDCPDGLAASWVALKWFQSQGFKEVEVLGCCHQTTPPTIKNNSLVIIVDFSFVKEVLESWRNDQNCEVVVIDHHELADKGRFLNLSQGILVVFNNSHCGAYLTWEFFYPEIPVPIFIRYVENQDLWLWKLPYGEEIREAFVVLGRSYELFDKLAPMSDKQFLDFMVPIGRKTLEERRKKVKELAQGNEWRRIGSYTVPVVCLSLKDSYLTSDVCSFLYTQFPFVPFSACYTVENDWDKGERVIQFSLRASKASGFATNEVARLFGGDGHKPASGFKIVEKFKILEFLERLKGFRLFTN